MGVGRKSKVVKNLELHEKRRVFQKKKKITNQMSDAFNGKPSVKMTSFGVKKEMLFSVEELISSLKNKFKSLKAIF